MRFGSCYREEGGVPREPASEAAEIEAEYHTHVAVQLARRVHVAALTAAAVIALDIALAAVESPTFTVALGERLVALGCVLAIAWLARARSAVRLGFGLSVALVLVMSAELMAAVVRTGGAASPYMPGAAILVVAVGLFLPYSTRRMVGVAAVMLAIYVVPLAVIDLPGQFRNAPVSAFVVLAATLCAIIGTHQLDRLHRAEFVGARALRDEQAKIFRSRPPFLRPVCEQRSCPARHSPRNDRRRRELR